ncbi:MAG: glycosyltransferase [Magnetococcales bacterium]|nr:glycosyltransferase [Magnetococcales bacterium]
MNLEALTEKLQSADGYFRAGLHADALLLYGQVMNLFPNDPDILPNLARWLTQTGNTIAAEYYLQRGRTQYSDHAQFPIDGNRVGQSGPAMIPNWDDEPQFEDWPTSKLQAVNALFQEGRSADAAVLCDRITACFPDNAELFFCLIQMFITSGNLITAENRLRQGVEKYPTVFNFVYDLASLLYWQRRRHEAFTYARKAVEVNPIKTATWELFARIKRDINPIVAVNAAQLTPKISVLIPCYNHADYVGGAIESVLAQDYGSIEIIVVDDGSTDHSWSVINGYCARDTRVKGIPMSCNSGVVHALNRGLRDADGDLIGMLASDDRWALDRLAKQLPCLDKHPGVVAVGGNACFVSSLGHVLNDDPMINQSRVAWLKQLFLRNAAFLPSLLIRRAAVDKIGYLDPRLTVLSDLDYNIRILLLGDIYIVPETVVYFGILPNQQNLSSGTVQTIAKFRWEQAKAMRNYLKLSFDEFEEIFDKKIADRSATSIAVELAKIACETSDDPAYRLFAVDILYDDPLTQGSPEVTKLYHELVTKMDPLNLIALLEGRTPAGVRVVNG